MKMTLLAISMILSTAAFAEKTKTITREPAQTHTVRGHVRSNGTYVAPYIRTNPDGIKSNNIRQ